MSSITRRTVDELNDLAEKMYGVNPKARTDAEALNYIEQHYTGGGSSGGDINILKITIPSSLKSTLEDEGIDCYPQSLSEFKVLYDTIHAIENNDKLLDSIVMLQLEGEFCVPLSIIKANNGIALTGILYANEMGDCTNVGVETYENGYLIFKEQA